MMTFKINVSASIGAASLSANQASGYSQAASNLPSPKGVSSAEDCVDRQTAPS